MGKENEIIKKINNLKKIHDTDWFSFQEEVYRLITNRIKNKYKSYEFSISNSYSEMVDIVIEIKTMEISLHEEIKEEIKLVFIECKSHKKTVSLQYPAQSFLAALRYKPELLVLVSLNEVSSTVLDFADFFFRTNGNSNHQSNIKFEFFTISDLLLHNNRTNNLETLTKFTLDSTELTEWRIVQSTPFNKWVLYSNEMESEYLQILTNDNNSISLELYFNGVFNNKKLVIDLLDEFNNVIDLSDNFDIKTFNNSYSIYTYDLMQFAKSDFTIKLPKMVQVFSTKYNSKKINLNPPKIIHCSELSFNNLRKDLSKNLYDNFSNNFLHTIFFIYGEGGVGKSYLSENLCFKANENLNYTVSRLNANDSLNIGAFLEILIDIAFKKNKHFKHNIETDKTKSLLSSILSNIAPNSKIDEKNLELFYKQSLNENEIDVILNLITRIISCLRTPLLIYLENCQHLNSQFIKLLMLFIDKLHKYEWKNVKIIIEFREKEISIPFENMYETILQKYPKRVNNINIKPLTFIELFENLKDLIINENKTDIITQIFNKTGGNPLFIDQLFHTLISEGYCCTKQFDVNEKKYLFDYKSITKKLNKIPNQIIDFLNYRVNQTIKNLNYSNLKLKTSHFLILLGIWEDKLEFEIMKKVLEVNDEQTISIIELLVREKILKLRLDNSPVFIHEFMQVATIHNDNLRYELRPLIKSININTEENNIYSQIIKAKLYSLFGDSTKAFTVYDLAFQLSDKKGLYVEKIKSIEGLISCLSQQVDNSFEYYAKLLELKLQYGWLERQSGSLINSLSIFNDSIALVNKLLDFNEIQLERLSYHYLVEFQHQILDIYYHMHWLDKAIEVCKNVIKNVKNHKKIFDIINRYLLVCYSGNFPKLGLNICELALKITRKLNNKECYSVIYSDIGHLFLYNRPEITKKFWEAGYKLAVEPRQKTHSAINKLIVNSHLNSNDEKHNNSIIDLENRINELGVFSQLCRLYNLLGVKAIINEDYENSSDFFQKALNNARITNQNFQEWQILHNLSILHLKLNNITIFEKYIQNSLALATAISKFKTKYSENDIDLTKQFDELIRAIGDPLCVSEFEELTLPNEPPEYSGSYFIYNINIKKLHDFFNLNLPFDFILHTNIKPVSYNPSVIINQIHEFYLLLE